MKFHPFSVLGLCALLGVVAAGETTPEALAPVIRLNTLGYLPGAPKKASVVTTARDFTVVRVTDGQVVLRGKVGQCIHNPDTDEEVTSVDFSALDQTGDYRIEIAGLPDSVPFRVAADLYRGPFALVTRGMYLWRCGIAVEGEWQGARFHHAACHTHDAWTDFVNGRHESVVSTGGWHDAGDYNKYVVNAGVTVASLLRAWEDFGSAIKPVALQLPEGGGTWPEFLAEVKFETDWLFSMQAADGSVYSKVSTQNFGGFILPEKEDAPRYFCPWSSPATADFVAMLAQAARAFRPYDPAYAERCLAAAKKSYAFLLAHPEDHAPDQSHFKTGAYPTADPDERLWAAAEIWETTENPAALKDLEGRIATLGSTIDEVFDWGEVKNLGLFTYLFSQHEGRNAKQVAAVRAELLATADRIVAKARAHGYARPLGDVYYWGGNGGVARQSLILESAYRVSHDSKYHETTLDALNYLFGRNVDGRSYVTGLGNRPPMHPHDRRSAADEVEQPWPGYLVGGPHPSARSWKDRQGDFALNEIAINWNGALIYALASAVAEKPAERKPWSE